MVAEMPMVLTAEKHVDDCEEVLVQAAIAGDHTAFDVLVSRYRKLVYAVAFRITQNHEEADDLAQESFVRAYTNLRRFRGEASFKTWLLRITTNLSLNVVKSARVARDSGEELPEHADANDSQHAELEADEQRLQLRKAIHRLPPKQQQSLLLKTYQDLTCEEVADMMGCSVGTVKANIFNGLKRLKSLLSS